MGFNVDTKPSAADLAAVTHTPRFTPHGSHPLTHTNPPARRPGYRWFIAGAPRSGTNNHQDPFATSAWNTCVVGHKRWVMFHPDTPEDWIKLPNFKEDPRGKSLAAAGWFSHVYPRTLAAVASDPDWPVAIFCHPLLLDASFLRVLANFGRSRHCTPDTASLLSLVAES